MSEFDKWWDKRKTSGDCNCLECVSKDTWKAALEWLLTQPLCGYSSDIVKKELESL